MLYPAAGSQHKLKSTALPALIYKAAEAHTLLLLGAE